MMTTTYDWKHFADGNNCGNIYGNTDFKKTWWDALIGIAWKHWQRWWKHSWKHSMETPPCPLSLSYYPFDLFTGSAGENAETPGQKELVKGRKARSFLFFIKQREIVAAAVSPNHMAGGSHGHYLWTFKTAEIEFQTTCFFRGETLLQRKVAGWGCPACRGKGEI